MHCWRITKYNPEFRDSENNYLKKDWTSFSDIGKKYNSKILTLNKYLKVESKYIEAILLFMNRLAIPYMFVNDLEKTKLDNDTIIKFKSIYTEDILAIYNTIKNENKYTGDDIKNICKLILREDLWLKLEYPEKMFVHFGYDFYMYVGSSTKDENLLLEVNKYGLFVEEHQSPYLNKGL